MRIMFFSVGLYNFGNPYRFLKATLKTMDPNKLQVIHAIADALVIGTISVWLKRKIDKTDNEVAILTKKVGQLEDIIKKQGELLMRHEMFLTGHAHPRKPQPKEESAQPDIENITEDTKKPDDIKSNVSEIPDGEKNADEIDKILENELKNVNEKLKEEQQRSEETLEIPTTIDASSAERPKKTKQKR